jgi:5-methylcytosine-specific restriction protein B
MLFHYKITFYFKKGRERMGAMENVISKYIELAKKGEYFRHCHISKDGEYYRKRLQFKGLVDNFLREPTESNFKLFWNKDYINCIEAVAIKLNANNIIKSNDIENLQKLITKIISLSPSEKMEKEIENSDNKIKNSSKATLEFYYNYHIREDLCPLINGGAEDGLRILFANTNYSGLSDWEKYFKLKEIFDKDYKPTDISIPYKFYLIDQLLNLVSKFKDASSDNEAVNSLYEEVRKLQSNSNKNDSADNNSKGKEDNMQDQPLNQILFGPPGTGKTYNTINKALAIIENKSTEALKEESRDVLKNRFNLLVKSKENEENWQIIFTTFHQNMSYEDFVEGIKATTSDGHVEYDIEHGIFEQICKKAKENYENYHKSKNKGNILEIDKLINDFANYVEEKIDKGENVVLPNKNGSKCTIARVNRNYNDNFLSFSTGGTVKDQSLTKNVIIRDYENYLKGNIKTYKDVKPRFESLSISHGNAAYYFGLYVLIKDFQKDNYLITNEVELKNYVLIIDEINRGNVSQIFGELITLIEEDKRIGKDEALTVTLPYSKEAFSVPKNLYIIGTMNTADRSVEALDTALRRRFSFEEMMPKPELLKNEKGDDLVIEGINLKELLTTINKRIEKLLDKDHLIGHSYFLNIKEEKDLRRVFKNNVIPLLQEYFFGDYGKIGLVLGNGFVEEVEGKDEIRFATFKHDDETELSGRKIYKIKDNFNIVEALKVGGFGKSDAESKQDSES